MPFLNRIRIPIKITRPQYPETKEVFRKANGETVTLSVVIQKQYQGETDLLPDKIHERIKIALSHDTVNIEGERYVGGISQEGDYSIDWPEFLDYPLGKGNFKANITPFDASNSNCGVCEDFTQVVCEDDNIGVVGEDETVTVPVLDNDAVCCYPATVSITTFNSTYVASIGVVNNEVVLTTKTPLVTQTGVVLATYKVMCENGFYDEADIIADIDGSEEGCSAPENVEVTNITPTGGVTHWDDPADVPDEYYWELYEQQTPGVPVQTGTAEIGSYPVFEDLTEGTDYLFVVKSICGEISSNFVEVEFTTPEASTSCGDYFLVLSGATRPSNVTYMDCNGDFQTVLVTTLGRHICALQNDPGDPQSISFDNPITITYEGLC